jgi:hypothetical protein
VSAAQGKPVEVTARATLRIHLPSIKHWIETDFLIIDQLVVPAVLGTPSIDRYVVSIFPKKKSLLLQIQEDVEPEEVRVLSRTINSTTAVRVSKACVIPAFSKT